MQDTHVQRQASNASSIEGEREEAHNMSRAIVGGHTITLWGTLVGEEIAKTSNTPGTLVGGHTTSAKQVNTPGTLVGGHTISAKQVNTLGHSGWGGDCIC